MNDSSDHSLSWLQTFADLGYGALVSRLEQARWVVEACGGNLAEMLGLSGLGPLEGRPEHELLDELAARSVLGAPLRHANADLGRRHGEVRTDVLRLARPEPRVLERYCGPWPGGGEDRRLWLFKDVTAQEATRERYKRKSLHEEMLALLVAEVLDLDGSSDPNRALSIVCRALGANGVHLALLNRGAVGEASFTLYSRGATPLDLTGPMVAQALESLAVSREGLLRLSAGQCPRAFEPLFAERPSLVLLLTSVRSFDHPAGMLLAECAQLRSPGNDEGRFLVNASFAMGIWCRQRWGVSQLESAAAKVKAAEASRTEFMAIVSHEFRSPLGPILGLSQMLAETCDCQDPNRMQMLAQISESASNLRELVEDLLTITRLDGGADPGTKYPVDLRLLGETAEGCFKVFSKGRSLTFHKTIPAEPGHINADGVAIKRAVRALISNAARFTPDGGTVRFTVVTEPGWVSLAVEDTGPGISPDMLERMFNPFVQAEPALTRRKNGAGLGLTLVDRLARSHGGTVVGRNNDPGPGATFELTLPRILPEDEETVP